MGATPKLVWGCFLLLAHEFNSCADLRWEFQSRSISVPWAACQPMVPLPHRTSSFPHVILSVAKNLSFQSSPRSFTTFRMTLWVAP